MALTPQVLWAQRTDRILISVQLDDIQDEQISVTANKFEFTAHSNGKDYAVSVEFYEPIEPSESTQHKGDREYFFNLKKKHAGPYWPTPINAEQKPSWLKVDFNRWKDEDADDDEDSGAYDDPTLEDMMRNLG